MTLFTVNVNYGMRRGIPCVSEEQELSAKVRIIINGGMVMVEYRQDFLEKKKS